MKAGRLRHRVTIQKLTSAKDEHGQPVDTWEFIANRRASILPKSGKENISSDAENNQAIVTIRMRYDSVTKSITPKNRIVYSGVYYDIQPISNVHMKNRELIFVCEVINGI